MALATSDHEARTSVDRLTDQINDALFHAQELVRAEMALAKAELKSELASAKYACVAFGIGTLVLNVALVVLAFGLLLSIGPSVGTTFGVAAALLILAAAAFIAGKNLLDRPHMNRTRRRIARDARALTHARSGEGR